MSRNTVDVDMVSFITRNGLRWVTIGVHVLATLSLHKMGNTAKIKQVERV